MTWEVLWSGEFKYPDVSSPLNKILDSTMALNQDEDFPSLQGGCLSVSPYNPHFDEVFQLSSRTPDVSPSRYQPRQPAQADSLLKTSPARSIKSDYSVPDYSPSTPPYVKLDLANTHENNTSVPEESRDAEVKITDFVPDNNIPDAAVTEN